MKKRNFQLRIWDIKNKKWHEPSVNQFDNIVQLYIGLEDKNGNPLFEGDICRVNTWDIPMDENKLSISYINYCEDRACYRFLARLDTEVFQMDMHFLDAPEKYPEGTRGNGRTCKIESWKVEKIGNIIENPELLDVNKIPRPQSKELEKPKLTIKERILEFFGY